MGIAAETLVVMHDGFKMQARELYPGALLLGYNYFSKKITKVETITGMSNYYKVTINDYVKTTIYISEDSHVALRSDNGSSKYLSISDCALYMEGPPKTYGFYNKDNKLYHPKIEKIESGKKRDFVFLQFLRADGRFFIPPKNLVMYSIQDGIKFNK